MDTTTASLPLDSEPALHKSQIDMLFRCGVQFERRYLNGEKRPPGMALLTGISVHKARELDLVRKRDTGASLPPADVADAAAMAFDKALDDNGGEVVLDEDERDMGKAKALGAGKDMSVTLSVLHNQEIVPMLEPLHVERKVRVRVPGIRRPIEGAFDLQTNLGSLHDLKTSGKKLGIDAIQESIQFPLYSMLAEIVDGKPPRDLRLEVLQKNKKPLAYQVVSPAPRTHAPILAVLARAERIIESGAFTPADPTSWVCSQKFCGYWDDCPFGRARRAAFPVVVL